MKTIAIRFRDLAAPFMLMNERTKLFLCGDLMTGRGIDQVLPHPGDPRLYEPSVRNASEYVALAERAGGPLPPVIDFNYIWSDALEVLGREQPQAKIINLETAITRSDAPWPSKDVHYKMSPDNTPCLTAAGIDCCVLANNPILDWGVPGLLETFDALDAAGIKHAGAGRTLREAQAPAIMEIGTGSRAIVFGLGSTSSGIPAEWSAGEDRPGLHIIETQREDPVSHLAKTISAIKKRETSSLFRYTGAAIGGTASPPQRRDSLSGLSRKPEPISFTAIRRIMSKRSKSIAAA